MGFSKIHSTQVGLVINLLTGSISPQYHVCFGYMLSTLVISTSADPEVYIRRITSKNSKIKDVLYQEDDPEFNGEWLTVNERLTRFIKYREQIVGRVKVEE